MQPNFNLKTIKQFQKEYPAFTEGTLRALVFHSKTNGFDKVIVRFSPTGKRGRVLINVTKFFEWLENQRKGGENNV